jgi:peptidoglycan/xylan/chitin deacetylase (PgdA/CDA1 family)
MMNSPSRRETLKAISVASALAAVGAHTSYLKAKKEIPMADTLPASSFWPDGARLVISISMQFEAGAQPERGAQGPFPPLDPKYPDLPMQKWYEYGIKEGVPRLLNLWDAKKIKVTSHMVGQAVERHPDLAREIVERGHEPAGHGQTWTPQYAMTPEDERAAYLASVATITKITGTRPIGFNAFWLRGTPRTLEILQDLGFIYHIDDISRDEPFVVAVRGKPFGVVPYTIRNNDIVRYDSPALTVANYTAELRAEFDQLYDEAGQRRRMMSISTHDRISGTPARVRLLGEFIDYAKSHPGVVFMRKDQIARWAMSQNDVPREGLI